MKSFRTEFENPLVEKDIIELEKKIRLFKEGQLNEEKFRSLRLARGVYGQRQMGVQMIRIKLPFGRVTSKQLRRIAKVSDEYSTGKLHITTRQDIQIHYVSLDRTPELWAELEKDDVTLREACGNTVRNVTASETAGIDPKEPFDVSPYANAVFKYFLRNPVSQEMGRKFKISFSGTEDDTALTFMHDLGFIAQQRNGQRGFKVMLGGGLGSQPREADCVNKFLPEDQLIPFIESVIRVFDRYGEREKRMKARMRFLINDIGLQAFLDLVKKQSQALPNKVYPIDLYEHAFPVQISKNIAPKSIEVDQGFENWRKYHVFPQKQEGYFAIGIKVKLGNFSSEKARKLADLIDNFAAGELRFTLRQNILLRHVREDLIPFFYNQLQTLGFTELGYNSTSDITACPGTDTCNLGISSSTGIAYELEKVLQNEYPQFLFNDKILIKISGCMNACGQHNMAHIGFQGMTIKVDGKVAPALQVLIGGGTLGEGKGRFSDKVIKILSKRGPDALRILLNDFDKNGGDLSFLNYYDAKGKTYFYDLLKPLASNENVKPDEFIDWGHDKEYVKAIGIGECAGVVIDLVATLLFEAEEKIEHAINALHEKRFADGIYHAYNIYVNTAKALLTSREIKSNSQAQIIQKFTETFGNQNALHLSAPFDEVVFSMNTNEPNQYFAEKYIDEAVNFYKKADNYYKKEQENQLISN